MTSSVSKPTIFPVNWSLNLKGGNDAVAMGKVEGKLYFLAYKTVELTKIKSILNSIPNN